VKSSPETQRVVSQFDSAEQAARYSSEFNTHRQQRSRQAIVQAFEGLEPGSHVLDLPCGTGRLMPLILELGFSYSGADASGHMVDAARGKLAELQAGSTDALPVSLAVEDVMGLSYPDATFDAVIVNRLFHHYTRAETRISALTELARVSKGPIIVFFLNTWTVRGLLFHLKHRKDNPMERTPVSLGEFRANGRAAGLTLTATYATRGRFNKEWYARFESL
jgi:ubiquinone/menaquinone biosynthesis C-methylase UbiE